MTLPLRLLGELRMLLGEAVGLEVTDRRRGVDELERDSGSGVRSGVGMIVTFVTVSLFLPK